MSSLDHITFFNSVPTGSVTVESDSEKVKKEGDESYELGANRKRPDLVIQVVVSSGRIDKLAPQSQKDHLCT